MNSTDLQRLETGIRQAHAQGDDKTVRVLGAELRRIQQMPMPNEAPPKRTWGGAAVEGVFNIPSSAAELATGYYDAVTHPIRTAKSWLDIAAGGVALGTKKLSPSAFEFIKSLDRTPGETERIILAAQQFGGQMAARYGTEQAFLNTLATDPVGLAADASTLLSGGAGAVRAACFCNIVAHVPNPRHERPERCAQGARYAALSGIWRSRDRSAAPVSPQARGGFEGRQGLIASFPAR